MKEDALILVVEDDDNEAWKLQAAFHKASIPNPLKILANGAQAMAYLGRDGSFSDRAAFPMPGLVFTDLKMPIVGGIELLRWIKQRPETWDIPVFLLIGAEDLEDFELAEAYASGASLAVSKAVRFDSLVEEIRLICEEALAH